MGADDHIRRSTQELGGVGAAASAEPLSGQGASAATIADHDMGQRVYGLGGRLGGGDLTSDDRDMLDVILDASSELIRRRPLDSAAAGSDYVPVPTWALDALDRALVGELDDARAIMARAERS